MDVTIQPLSKSEFQKASSIIIDQHGWPFLHANLEVLYNSPTSNFMGARDASTGELCGFINLIIQPSDLSTSKATARGYIACLIIKDQYQRMGIGRKLMLWCLQKSREAQCETVWLSASAPGAPLYATLGFQSTGHSTTRAKDGPTWSLGESVQIKKQLEKAHEPRQLIWASVETMRKERSQLWRWATEMINRSLDVNRTQLTEAYLAIAKVFFLVEASSNEDEATPHAVIISRPTSKGRQQLGPLLAKSGEDARLLYDTVLSAGDGEGEKITYLIASDTRYDDGAFDNFLQADGDSKTLLTLKIMEIPLEPNVEPASIIKSAGDARQFAVMDLGFD